AHNKNKPSITPNHTRTTTSRLLSEYDTESSIYDSDEDMESVKENFERQTSQRFEEYKERMKEKRQKRKEQRDKNVQEIIEKDKREKSLAQKVEKGCLMCGCGLGGVAASVGIFGTVAVKEWTKAATVAAIAAAKKAGAAEGAAAGHAAGAAEVIRLIKKTFDIEKLGVTPLKSLFDAHNYTESKLISGSIYAEYQGSQCASLGAVNNKPICSIVTTLGMDPSNGPAQHSTQRLLELSVQSMVSDAERVAAEVTNTATEKAIATLRIEKTGVVDATYASCQTAIIASVVAMLVIVLVMVIIYLILRYRRKKKMNKKQQYTKLLSQ
ncbi:hypothetical protein PFMC_05273, partial [Plasmodium falciparum CAMP/Malaysia]